MTPKKKPRVEAAMTVEAYRYFCPHFGKMVIDCTCHKRPVYKVANPSAERVYRAAVRYYRAEHADEDSFEAGERAEKAADAFFEAVAASLKGKR